MEHVERDNLPFNKGAVMNAGFLEASKLDNFTCFVFHDIDMVPETDLAIYNCPQSHKVQLMIYRVFYITLILGDASHGSVSVKMEVQSHLSELPWWHHSHESHCIYNHQRVQQQVLGLGRGG